jgi:hypothetical protein
MIPVGFARAWWGVVAVGSLIAVRNGGPLSRAGSIEEAAPGGSRPYHQAPDVDSRRLVAEQAFQPVL